MYRAGMATGPAAIGWKVSFLNRSSPAIRLVCNPAPDVEDDGHGFNHGHFFCRDHCARL